MEQLAVLSDLHANLSALKAVCSDLEQRGLTRAVVLGDLVGYLTRPNQVTALVSQMGWPVIRGNYDRAVLEGPGNGADKFLKPGIGPEPKGIFHWTCGRVNPETTRFLRELPAELRFQFGRVDCLAVARQP